MSFASGSRSTLLFPFTVPGAVAMRWLLGRALWRGGASMRCWLTLIAVPTLSVSQWMLGYAGWFDSHDRHSTVMFCVLWHVGTALGPGYYLCFRSLTNEKFRWRPLVRHLLPGLTQNRACCRFGGVRPAVVPRPVPLAVARLLRHQGHAGPAAGLAGSHAAPKYMACECWPTTAAT